MPFYTWRHGTSQTSSRSISAADLIDEQLMPAAKKMKQ